jgi:hypothetical protein
MPRRPTKPLFGDALGRSNPMAGRNDLRNRGRAGDRLWTGHESLFGFVFNNSNIDAMKFFFESFPPCRWSQVEVSILLCNDLVEAVSDVAEEACTKLNRITAAMLADGDRASAADEQKSFGALVWEIDDRVSVAFLECIFRAGQRP